MRTTDLSIAVAVVGFAFAAAGMAGEQSGAGFGPSGWGDRSEEQLAAFEELDSDNDGYISRQEADQSSRIADKWHKADTNADGHLDQAEFRAFETMREAQKGSERR